MSVPTQAIEVDPAEETRRGSSVGRYLALKAGGALISLGMVVVMGFFAFRILPGDPAISLTRGRQVSADEIARLREELGLDSPVWAQFFRYVRDLFTGDLGTSYTFNVPVTQLIAERVVPTLLLTGTAAVIAVVLGLWIGQKAAWKRDSAFDKVHSALALLFWSVPTFWLGLLLLLAFTQPAVQQVFGFPTAGMVTPGANYQGIATSSTWPNICSSRCSRWSRWPTPST